MPIDYSKAKIYKLTTIHDPELVYYGSTVNPLYKRKNQHKGKFKNGELKCTSSKLFELGIDDVEITLIESIICNNKEELHQRERFYIENNNCVNKVIPSRGRKEYRKEYEKKNKDKILEKKKEYNEKNKEKRKQYYEDNKDKKNEYDKQYREKNKDKSKQYMKTYYEQNKDILKIKKKEYYEKKKDKKRCLYPLLIDWCSKRLHNRSLFSK